MLSRIVDPGPNKNSVEEDSGTKAHADNGYGIAPDPLTQFAVVFSALIHDVGKLHVDHLSSYLRQTLTHTLVANILQIIWVSATLSL